MEINNKNNNKSKLLVMIALFAINSVVSLLLGVGLLLVVFHFYPDLTQHITTNVTKTEKEVTVTDSGIADAVEKIYDSVVIIKNYQQNKLYATGTGFVYKKDNDKYYLLTNYHVIQGGTSIGVVFTNGEEVKVTIEGGDKYADIAVLSYESKSDIKVAETGSSIDMRVGDTVFAIGAPLDYSVYSWSVTRGILSGKDREVEVSTTDSNSSDWIMQVLQTDAAINSGNSGGPLCNSNGQVIGINNMKLSSTGIEGMGFAIPIEEAITYADAVISGENVSRPFIGISMLEASNAYVARQYGVTATDGVLIAEVSSNSPADKAGLKEKDIITEINGNEITGIASLRYQLYKYKAGDTITVTYIRNGKTKEAKLTLTSSQ